MTGLVRGGTFCPAVARKRARLPGRFSGYLGNRDWGSRQGTQFCSRVEIAGQIRWLEANSGSGRRRQRLALGVVGGLQPAGGGGCRERRGGRGPVQAARGHYGGWRRRSPGTKPTRAAACSGRRAARPERELGRQAQSRRLSDDLSSEAELLGEDLGVGRGGALLRSCAGASAGPLGSVTCPGVC